MKKIIFLLMVAASLKTFPQTQQYYTFSELRGMEDNEGNTHLFYRLFNEWEDYPSSGSSNSIYHLNTDSGLDTLFLDEFSNYHEFLGGYIYKITDLKFWNRNPNKYIFSGSSGRNEVSSFINRFDSEGENFVSFNPIENVEISQQNDSLLIAGGYENWFMSTDGGRNWQNFLDEHNFNFVFLTPFDDVIFASKNSMLFKSTNGGGNFHLVDTNNTGAKFYYDADSIHIYSLGYSMLRITNNSGEAFSWFNTYAGENKIYISVDYSQSGHIYLADGRFIYHSSDYGNSFSLFKELDRKIIGIYKKPGSDILYAATKYDLYEVTSDKSVSIKHLNVDPEIMEYFPLSVGNKWWYSTEFCDGSFPCIPTDNIIIEVVSDTIINSYTYKKIEKRVGEYIYFYFLRQDTLSGQIFAIENIEDGEFLYEDLVIDEGDTVYNRRGMHTLFEKDTVAFLGESTSYLEFGGNEGQIIWHQYRLVKGFGLSYESYSELGSGHAYLKGAIINGVVYGDTILAGVDDEQPVPNEFSLSQNYPNPFNPVTKIKYSVPVGTRHGVYVKLNVFDILGNEIATLVNEEKPAGNYEVEFNGSKFASGVYFYKLTADHFTQSKKLILLK